MVKIYSYRKKVNYIGTEEIQKMFIFLITTKRKKNYDKFHNSDKNINVKLFQEIYFK